MQKVTLEVPALTPAAAELLMARSQAKVLEPDQAFRRSFEAVANAWPGWKGPEAQEMARLIAACYATLTATRPHPPRGLRGEGRSGTSSRARRKTGRWRSS